MEHAGATFLNEDGVLFRTAPTASDYFRRNTLVLHETCHQWFGDLVTMRWFDDLWLKEGFAQYMAYKALAELEPASQPWKHFYEDIKPSAYGIDETQGTTPIYQVIPNLLDAKSAYGAIVYQKAPAVLKQLNFFLGEDAFRNGLRLYLKQHAYANAQWADLVGAFESASGTLGQHKDVQTWAKAWILQRGMPEIEVHYRCNAAGEIESLTATQRDLLDQGAVWPIASEWLLGYLDPDKVDSDVPLRVEWNGPKIDGNKLGLIGRSCPAYVLLNSGDYGYGRFLLDAGSQTNLSAVASAGGAGKLIAAITQKPGGSSFAAITEQTIEPKLYVDTPIGRSMVYGSFWESVRVARMTAAQYVGLATESVLRDEDESLTRIQGSRFSTALHAYLGPGAHARLLPDIEWAVGHQMFGADSLELRIVNFRTFTAIAESPQALSYLKALLNGTESVPGMPLKSLDRWNIIGHLIAMHDPDAGTLLAAEKDNDHSGEGQKYAYAIQAGTPDAATKTRYFADYLSTTNGIQEDWLTQSLRPFNSWNQAPLTEPYLTQSLDALAQIKRTRKIFFLGAWLSAFLDGQHSPEAQAAVHAWLASQTTDPDLRLKVLEASDALDRTVLIRTRFPE